MENIGRRFGEFRVYNFGVAGTHTYFVGKTGVLVHNKCPEYPAGEIPNQRVTDLAEKYLGRGYTEESPGRFVSQDGMRQFRLTKHEVNSTPMHAHFEAYDKSYFQGGKLTETSTATLK